MADRAQEYTLMYFSALRDRLKIQEEDGRPVFMPGEVNTFSFQMLATDLQELFDSRLRESALVDLEAIPRDERQIQTTAVGYAQDFHLLVKLGYLLGDRVVLWDTMIINYLRSGVVGGDLISFGKTVCEILMLEPIVKAGGLVFLPHPVVWLERAAEYYRACASAGEISPVFAGYINARALLDEGIAIHPYSLELDSQRSEQYRRAIVGDDCSYFSDGSSEYQNALIDFMHQGNFEFWEEVDVCRFYSKFREVPGEPNSPRDQLREILSLPKGGMSPQQLSRHKRKVIKRFDAGVEDFNRAMRESEMVGRGAAAAATGATASFVVAATTAFLAEAADFAGFFAVIGAGLAAYARAIPLITRHYHNDSPLSIYQIFSELGYAANNSKI